MNFWLEVQADVNAATRCKADECLGVGASEDLSQTDRRGQAECEVGA